MPEGSSVATRCRFAPAGSWSWAWTPSGTSVRMSESVPPTSRPSLFCPPPAWTV